MGVKRPSGDRTDAFSADATGQAISDEVEVVPFEEQPNKPHWRLPDGGQ
jgi:hypothetical protein